MPSPALTIERLDAAGLDACLPALSAVLADTVAADAAIGFVMPFDAADAAAYWREQVRPAVAGGGRVLLAAQRDGRTIGTAQLDCATPANQPHRADVMKVAVAPAHRRKGVARALMQAIEAEAARRGRWLLTLDTRTGDAAEPLYRSLGYVAVGVIPDYAGNPFRDGRHRTTIMYKRLQLEEADVALCVGDGDREHRPR